MVLTTATYYIFRFKAILIVTKILISTNVVYILILETAKYIQELKKLLQTPTEITVVLSFLIFPKGVPQLLYDGATKTTVRIFSLLLNIINLLYFLL